MVTKLSAFRLFKGFVALGSSLSVVYSGDQLSQRGLKCICTPLMHWPPTVTGSVLLSRSPLSTRWTQRRTKAQTVRLFYLYAVLRSVAGEQLLSNPFDAIGSHAADYDLLGDPDKGFLSRGYLVMRVGLKDITTVWQLPGTTLGDDMRIINVESFGSDAVASRLKEGKVLGLVPKKKVRSCILTANLLIRKYMKSVRPSLISTNSSNQESLGSKLTLVVVRTVS